MGDNKGAFQKSGEVHRDGDVVLRDGSTVRIRVMRPSDEAGLSTLLTSLSEDSRWLRFYCLQNSSALAAEAHREANLDQTFGLVACSGEQDRVVGHAFYVVIDEERAEVAFTIANDFQGRGLGTILLCQLAEVAAATAAGARATSSHTGALIAASDVTVDALFRQAGVVRTDTLAELFDVASLFANQPLPHGRRVGIITNAGALRFFVLMLARRANSKSRCYPRVARPDYEYFFLPGPALEILLT